jgi:hypothetical protein
LAVESVPGLTQLGIVLNLEQFAQKRKVLALRDVDALPPIAQILDRRFEGTPCPVAVRRAQLPGQRQIVEMATFDAQRIEQIMPTFICAPTLVFRHRVPQYTPNDASVLISIT